MYPRQQDRSVVNEKIISYLKSHDEMFIEHCVFSWTVEDFKCKEWKNRKYACSPEFCIRSSYFSTWCVMFRCAIFVDEVPGIEFKLNRFNNTSAAKNVCVTFKFGLMNSAGNKVWFAEILERTFEKPDSYSFCTSVLDHLEDFYDGSLTILCEIYASAKMAADGTYKHYRDRHQICLSTALAKLYYFSHYHNVVLSADGIHHRVHKSIVSTRSTVFARFLKHGNAGIEIQDISKNNANSLLSFMYSGNLSFILQMTYTSTGLYEAAYNLDISGLAKLLTPNFITANTSLSIEESNFTWCIEDFSERRSLNNVVVSPEFSGNLSHASGWTIKLCNLDLSSSEEYIGIFIKPRSQKGDIDMSLEVSLLDENQRPWVTNLKNGLLSPGMLFGFPCFVKKSAFDEFPNNLFPHDTLTLQCKLRFTEKCNGMSWSASACTTYGEYSNVQLLQKELLEIFRSGELADFELSASDRTFRVHKHILAGRTDFFRAPQRQYLTSFKVQNMAPDILEKFLIYIYSGELNDMNVQLAKDMYIAGSEFLMSVLKDECLKYLFRSINLNFVLDIYLFAERFFETDLKDECLDYIKDNATELLNRREWRDFEQSDPLMARQILRERL